MPVTSTFGGFVMPYGPGWNSQTHSYPTPPAPAGTSSGLPNYNTSPQATYGQGPYGSVPGNIGIPPSTFQQVAKVAPGLGNTSRLTSNIMSELQGDINPQALKNMQDAAASYGVSSGMPGSNAIPGTLAFNKNLRNIGLDTLQVQRQGQQDYLSALHGIGGAQTPQSLAAEIAAHNAQLNAAPDPRQAAEQQLANYWNALNALRGPGGGSGGANPAGGTGAFAPQPQLPPSALASQQFGGALPNYGSNFNYGAPSGSGLSWAGNAPTDLFGDLGAPSQGSSFYPGTDVQGLPNLDSILGQPSYYDQSAQPDFNDPSLSNEDWMYNFGG